MTWRLTGWDAGYSGLKIGTKQIFVTPVDGKYKTVLINTTTEPYAIAVDPIEW